MYNAIVSSSQGATNSVAYQIQTSENDSDTTVFLNFFNFCKFNRIKNNLKDFYHEKHEPWHTNNIRMYKMNNSSNLSSLSQNSDMLPPPPPIIMEGTSETVSSGKTVCLFNAKF